MNTTTEKLVDALLRAQTEISAIEHHPASPPAMRKACIDTAAVIREALARYDAERAAAHPKEAAYVACGGTHCPSCNSQDIEGDSIEVDQGSASQRIGCNVCGSQWFDTYTLTGFKDFQLED